jgi:hypothetical protein
MLIKRNFGGVSANVAFYVVAAALLLGALSKVGQQAQLYEHLRRNDLFPVFAEGVIILFLPGLELVLSALMLMRRYDAETTFISSMLFSAFLVYACVVYSSGDHDCGCLNLQVPLTFPQGRLWGLLRSATMWLLSAHAFFGYTGAVTNRCGRPQVPERG